MNSLLTVREAVIAHLPAWEPHRVLSRPTSFRGETACRQWRLQVIENLVHSARLPVDVSNAASFSSSREGWPSEVSWPSRAWGHPGEAARWLRRSAPPDVTGRCNTKLLHITYVIGYICLIIAAMEGAVRNKMERYCCPPFCSQSRWPTPQPTKWRALFSFCRETPVFQRSNPSLTVGARMVLLKLRDFESEPRPLGSDLTRGNRVSRQKLAMR